MLKVRYVGESFGALSLTDDKVYDCEVRESDYGFLRVIDDSGEDYLYSPTNPKPLNGSSSGGKWEIVEDDARGTLKALIGHSKILQ